MWLRRKGAILEAQQRFQEALIYSDATKAVQTFQNLAEIRAKLSRLTFSGPGKEGVETYKKQISSVSNQQKAAYNANVLSKERYDKGVSSYLEVLETERSLFSVDLELSELRQQYLNAYVKLYKALGGGWITQ